MFQTLSNIYECFRQFRNHGQRLMAKLNDVPVLAWLGIWLLFIAPVMSGLAEDAIMCYTSSGSLKFYVNVCQFEGNSDKTLTEISYSLPLRQFLETQRDSTRQNSALSIVSQFINSSKDTLIDFRESRNIPLPSEQHRNTPDLFIDLKRFEIEPDTLNMKITIRDSASGREGFVLQPLAVRKFSHEFSLSDLFFVSHVQKADQQSVFDKNGILMLPIPSRSFFLSDGQKNAYVYYEINHMEFPSERPSFYSLHFAVQDMSGKDVFTQSQDAIRKSASTSSRIEIIPLQEIPAGIYKCEIRITDLESEQNREASGYFRLNSGADPEELMLPMSEKDVQKYYDQIKYITTHQQQETFKQLNATGKQRFLLNFWKSKDSDPTTPRNEFMEEHFSRIAYCDKNFSGGINSDMGRVYIQYGPPVEVTRRASFASTGKAIEIWLYSINGTTEFDFADRNGDGKYVLVNSTSPDEIHNPDWQQEIIRAIPESNSPF
jgi:GWxTD domain-containing protein